MLVRVPLTRAISRRISFPRRKSPFSRLKATTCRHSRIYRNLSLASHTDQNLKVVISRANTLETFSSSLIPFILSMVTNCLSTVSLSPRQQTFRLFLRTRTNKIERSCPTYRSIPPLPFPKATLSLYAARGK